MRFQKDRILLEGESQVSVVLPFHVVYQLSIISFVGVPFLLGAAEAKRKASVTEAMKGFHAILTLTGIVESSISYHSRTCDWRGSRSVDRRVDWLSVPCVLSHLTVAKYFPQQLSIPENICRVPLFLTNVRNPPQNTCFLPPNIGNLFQYWI